MGSLGLLICRGVIVLGGCSFRVHIILGRLPSARKVIELPDVAERAKCVNEGRYSHHVRPVRVGCSGVVGALREVVQD